MTHNEITAAINAQLTDDAHADWTRLASLGTPIAMLQVSIDAKRALYLGWYAQRRETAARFDTAYETHTGRRGGKNWFVQWTWNGEFVDGAIRRSKAAALRALEFTLKFN